MANPAQHIQVGGSRIKIAAMVKTPGGLRVLESSEKEAQPLTNQRRMTFKTIDGNDADIKWLPHISMPSFARTLATAWLCIG